MNDTQKKLDKEYRKLLKIIESAQKGKNWIRPLSTGYTDFQCEAYAKYDAIIKRANTRIEELKQEAAR